MDPGSDSEEYECTTKLRTPLRKLLNKFLRMQSRAPVFIVAIFFTAAIYSPSSPKFDIFMLHKTPQGILLLTILSLWVVLYLQRVYKHRQTYTNEKLQDFLFLICVALLIFSACLLVRYIEPWGEGNMADLQSKVLSVIPLALTVLPEVADKLVICMINGLDIMSHLINRMLRILAEMTRHLGHLLDTRPEDLERNSNEVQESSELRHRYEYYGATSQGVVG
ncbi:hypothetical protein EYC80_010461 [Monilinia laxa]|uniref:Uncharacterized protein n=1 Tax=Monilinia laxa TaxID=61186 RepID=A0A5N6JNP4_MONLA|nr:hypothetical protein EYC80_010461 [Monilinia laxa]